MATLRDIFTMLSQIPEEQSGFQVGVAPETKPDDVQQCLIRAYHSSSEDDVILQTAETARTQSPRQLTVGELSGALRSLHVRDDSVPVELSNQGPREVWRLDVPIVGARLVPERKLLVLLAWDRKSAHTK